MRVRGRLLLMLMGLAGCAPLDAPPPAVAPVSPVPAAVVKTIEWDDGDSGSVDGLPFRLGDVDSPEKGGVCARIGAALCPEERQLCLAAKAYMENLTRTGSVSISNKYDVDTAGRQVLDLTINGEDIGQRGMRDGILRSYKFEGRKALEKKPDWCAILGAAKTKCSN